MIMFEQASPIHQTVLLTAMFLTMLSSAFCIGLSRYGKQRISHIIADAAVFLVMLFFSVAYGEMVKDTGMGAFSENRLSLPVWVMWCIIGCAAAWLVYEVTDQLHRLNNMISRRSVKNAMDTLPVAICYFNPSGTVKLCNLQMHILFRSITQKDLQTLEELCCALEECGKSSSVIRLSDEKQTFLFPDGRVWHYTQTEVTAKNGVTYTEAAFSDVTELYEKHRELKRRNAELKEMYRDIKRLSDNVLEMTRENEILTVKTSLHDRMGAGIVAIRQSLQQRYTSEKNADSIELFYRAVKTIKNDNDSPVGRSSVEEFIHDASVAGIRVEITGSISQEENALRLSLLAMQESFTNAVRHADATVLSITAEKTDGAVSLRFENDGKPPQREVTPKGGLLNLSRHLEECGGKMEIESEPRFILKVTIPVTEDEQKEVSMV